MIGIRTGLATGIRLGLAVGIAADPLGPHAAQTTQTVTVTDSADPVITGGDAFSYTVQYTNTGGVAASSVQVQVTLDASLTYVSSSGTGWTINRAGQIVTCTRATASPGAAPTITISVTTGGSALTASTSAQATASNAATANGSQTTTVNLVSKDATAGVYMPASSTEWSNFIARKGLTISPPTSLYLCQEASGNLTDSIGGFTATAAGSGIAYQQPLTGWARGSVKFTDANATQQFSSTAVANLASNSWLRLALVDATHPATATRNMWLIGTASFLAIDCTTAGILDFKVSASGGATLSAYSGPHLVGHLWDRANSRSIGYTETEKVTGTFSSAATGAKMTIGVGANTNGPFGFGYIADWSGANAQMTDAQVKALYQALGITIPWS